MQRLRAMNQNVTGSEYSKTKEHFANIIRHVLNRVNFQARSYSCY